MKLVKTAKDILRKLENRKIKQALLTGTIVFSGLFASGSVNAQKADQKTNDMAMTITPTKEAVKHYINTVEVGSIDQIDIGMRHAAEYNDLIQGIIYTQYTMKDASKSEQSTLDYINSQILSPGTEDHEMLHHALRDVSRPLYDGSMTVSFAKRMQARIFEEVCCLKKQKRFSSIDEAIKDFQAAHKDETYARHYASNQGSIVLALSAKEDMKETVNKSFVESRNYKPVNIDGQKYFASQYVSQDKKFQTYCLYTDTGDMITTPEVLAKSSTPIGLLSTLDGKAVMAPDGKPAKAIYGGEETNSSGGWAGSATFAITNLNAEVQSYSFPDEDKNMDKIYSQYAKIAGLSAAELQSLKNFVGKIDLSSYDMKPEQIKEIREMYKGSSLEIEKKKLNAAYLEGIKVAKDKYETFTLPYLVEVAAPSSKTINYALTTAKASNIKGGK